MLVINVLNGKCKKLLNSINKLPRIKLANLPTPLQEAPRLSKALGGPHIYFKRDDLTGLPLTGNKARMFEFSLAKVIQENSEIVVGIAGVQSNYCRQLACACTKIGLKTYLLLINIRGENDHKIQGNLFLDFLVGSHVEIIKSDLSSIFIREQIRNKVIKKLHEKGYKKIYVMRSTEYDISIEGVGYTNCALELCNQLLMKNISTDYISFY